MQTIANYIFALFLHESFHYAVALLATKKKIKFSLTFSGFKGNLSTWRITQSSQLAVMVAGSLGNLVIVIILILFKTPLNASDEFIKANLFIGLFNLIPLYPLDGGVILAIFLYHRYGVSTTIKALSKVGIIIRSLFFILGTLMLVLEKNPSLLIVIICLPSLKKIRNAVRIMNLNAFLHRKNRIVKKKIYPIRHILVMDDVTLGEVLLQLDHDKYHVIYVVNQKLEKLLELSEHEFSNAISKFGLSKPIKEVFFNNVI